MSGVRRPGRRPLACEALEPGWLAPPGAIIGARVRPGLAREQVAGRMATTQSVVTRRVESGRVRPSTKTLGRYGRATGTRLRISFEPVGS